jgi:eukaryotic-like serine/threonine-protein kinase
MQGFEISFTESEGAAALDPTPPSDEEQRAVSPAAMPLDAASTDRADRRIGQVVDGKYLVLRRLACGGMGSVYEARHTVVGRHVALKFLHEQYAQRSCMVQRFLREAQAAGSIASEHIISVLDYGTSEGTPYLVMELVVGQDLREILAQSPRLPVERAVRIVLDACRGLALAHDRGLIHRDLKPANICVTRRSDGREVAKVIDFGVAKLRDGAELSEEGTLIGTLGYMAPEQLTDQKQLDARADIYALGVILYQSLAGRPPHICNRSELLYRIVSVDPKPLGELCPELPAGLAEVVHKALRRNKERRYAGVRELALALEPFAREDGASFSLPAVAASAPDPRTEPTRELRRGAGLGTAETELGSSPTWVALAQTTNSRAHRQCEPLGRADEAVAEQYCRHPDGLPLAPVRSSHQSLSQRALLLSVGALALSVVAMTTMFIFVYSHGSGALEAAATAASRSGARLGQVQSALGAAPSGAEPAGPSGELGSRLPSSAVLPYAAALPSGGALPYGTGNPSQGMAPFLDRPSSAPSSAALPAVVPAVPTSALPPGNLGRATQPVAHEDHCAPSAAPLLPASAIETVRTDGLSVQHRALQPRAGALPGALAVECE